MENKRESGVKSLRSCYTGWYPQREADLDADVGVDRERLVPEHPLRMNAPTLPAWCRVEGLGFLVQGFGFRV